MPEIDNKQTNSPHSSSSRDFFTAPHRIEMDAVSVTAHLLFKEQEGHCQPLLLTVCSG